MMGSSICENAALGKSFCGFLRPDGCAEAKTLVPPSQYVVHRQEGGAGLAAVACFPVAGMTRAVAEEDAAVRSERRVAFRQPAGHDNGRLRTVESRNLGNESVGRVDGRAGAAEAGQIFRLDDSVLYVQRRLRFPLLDAREEPSLPLFFPLGCDEHDDVPIQLFHQLFPAVGRPCIGFSQRGEGSDVCCIGLFVPLQFLGEIDAVDIQAVRVAEQLQVVVGGVPRLARVESGGGSAESGGKFVFSESTDKEREEWLEPSEDALFFTEHEEYVERAFPVDFLRLELFRYGLSPVRADGMGNDIALRGPEGLLAHGAQDG